MSFCCFAVVCNILVVEAGESLIKYQGKVKRRCAICLHAQELHTMAAKRIMD